MVNPLKPNLDQNEAEVDPRRQPRNPLLIRQSTTNLRDLSNLNLNPSYQLMKT